MMVSSLPPHTKSVPVPSVCVSPVRPVCVKIFSINIVLTVTGQYSQVLSGLLFGYNKRNIHSGLQEKPFISHPNNHSCNKELAYQFVEDNKSDFRIPVFEQ